MISIIIVVKNDLRIQYLLEKLHIHNKEHIEILVIDSSQGKLDKFKKKFDYVKWYTYKTKLLKTIPQQRNKGIKLAKGEIIVFIDSDCLPQKNWLSKLVKPILKENEAIVAGHVIHSNHKSIHAIEFAKNLGKVYLDEAPTMNLAIKRDVFKETGLFDNKFQCGEDVDFLWRAIRKGYRIRYAPNAHIYHDLGNSKNELRRMYQYGMARVHLYKKHRYKQMLFWGNEIFKILYPIYFLLLPVTWYIHYYPLLGLILIYINRKSKPFNQIIMKTIYGTGILKELLFTKYEKG